MNTTVRLQMVQVRLRLVGTMLPVSCQGIGQVTSFLRCYLPRPINSYKIEEVGSANFFGITADNEFVTPLSPSILPSITKYSLLYLAEHRLGLTPIEGDVPIDNLDRFVEAVPVVQQQLFSNWWNSAR